MLTVYTTSGRHQFGQEKLVHRYIRCDIKISFSVRAFTFAKIVYDLSIDLVMLYKAIETAMQHLIALRFHHSTELHLKVLSITAVHALIFLQEQLRCLIFAPASMLKRALHPGLGSKAI